MGSHINKDKIIELLESKIKYKGLKLPTYIDFYIEDRVLYMNLGKHNSTGGVVYSCAVNMQADEAAFEGWSICLKHHLHLNIDNVVLSWEKPDIIAGTQQLHYNRFSYRVIRFQQMFNWFNIAYDNKNEIIEFKKKLTGLGINTPLKESSKTSVKSAKEAQIEYSSDNLQLIKDKFQFECISHQLPVGVKKDNKSFFTGRASAIDIWGIDKRNNLNIFELKYNNKKVGIISELLFYSEVMYDLFILKQIKSPSKIKKVRNAECLYGADATPIKAVRSYFLFDKLHPMVVGTTALLNTNNLGIKFFNVQYKLKANSLLIDKLFYKGALKMEEEFKQASFRNSIKLGGYSHILKNADENLYESIRNGAKNYFKQNDIAWWKYGGNSGSEPTNHMLSSQIQCVNFLFELRCDKKSVLKLAQVFDPEINDILPVIGDKDLGYIAFEFVYDNANLLAEVNTNIRRGEYCTSIDAFIIAKRKDKKVLIPIEWKYTESYNDENNKALEHSKGKTRQSRYNHLIESSKQLKSYTDLANTLYYFEPFYELMRQTLLVEQMVLKNVANDFLHIIVAPSENRDLLSNNYSFNNYDFETIWRDSLYDQSKFNIIDSKQILQVIESIPEYSKLADYLKLRY